MSETVIITGHSYGLGAALAAAWLQCDARVLGIARSTNPALAATYPHTLQEIQCDLANAGTVAPSAPLGTQDDEQIALAVNLNITAPLLLSNAVVAEARRPDNVNIVHIGSGAGRKAYPGWSIYGASKAALDRHAASAANEERGVRIVSLAPGTVDTAMQEGMRRDPHFPLREHFAKIHADGGLQNANDTALKILAYCLSEQFGREAIVDIRSIELPL